MSLAPAEQRQLTTRAVLGTFAGMGWSLALVSAASVWEPVWRLLGATQSCLVNGGLAGRQHCPLCGMSHAFRALWQGHLSAALLYNPNSVALFSVMLVACASVALLWLPPARAVGRSPRLLPDA